MARSSTSSVALRYRDVAAASDWLCAAFGFQKHLVATSEKGMVRYAQLTFGDAMLMLAPVRDTALDKYMKQPDEIDGAETQSCYFRISDADAHYARSKASGAEIILDIQDDPFGGRSYACRDPEGHIWNFGTYDPWQGKRPRNRHAQSARIDLLGRRRRAVAIGFLATIVASVVGAGGMYAALRSGERSLETAAKATEEHVTRAAQERLKTELSAREAAEYVARDALEQLGRERIAKEAAERATDLEGKHTVVERSARHTAEDLVREARQELDQMRDTRKPTRMEGEQLDREARELAEGNAEQAKQQASEERSAREVAERAAQELREEVERNREEKVLAERSAEQARQRAREEQSAKEAAERAANEARAQLGRERSAKNAALKSAAQLRRQLNQVQKSPDAESPSSSNVGPVIAPYGQ